MVTVQIRDGKKSDPGSGMEKSRIRDPGWKKVGSGINIPDQQHLVLVPLLWSWAAGTRRHIQSPSWSSSSSRTPASRSEQQQTSKLTEGTMGAYISADQQGQKLDQRTTNQPEHFKSSENYLNSKLRNNLLEKKITHVLYGTAFCVNILYILHKFSRRKSLK
jgi:hypothetical protein